MTSKTPTWSAIASTVKTNKPTLQLALNLVRQTTVPQTSNATTGIRQNSATTKPPGGAGTCDLFQTASNTEQAVGLRNTASQTATFHQPT